MSRIRARISPNFADGFFTTPAHGHLSDRGGGAAATISAPIMGCWGLPETLFWGNKAWSLDYTKGWNKGSQDRDCPLFYGLLDIMAGLHCQSKNIIHSAGRAYFGLGVVGF